MLDGTTGEEVKDVTEELETAGKIDIIYEALCEAPNGTLLAQEYLNLKAEADNAIGNVKVLSEVNDKLREDKAKLELETRETRRLLDGRKPTIIEVEKKVEVAVAPKPVTKEPTMEDIKAFFEND